MPMTQLSYFRRNCALLVFCGGVPTNLSTSVCDMNSNLIGVFLGLLLADQPKGQGHI